MKVDEKLDFLIEGFTEMKLDIKEIKEEVSGLKDNSGRPFWSVSEFGKLS